MVKLCNTFFVFGFQKIVKFKQNLKAGPEICTEYAKMSYYMPECMKYANMLKNPKICTNMQN